MDNGRRGTCRGVLATNLIISMVKAECRFFIERTRRKRPSIPCVAGDIRRRGASRDIRLSFPHFLYAGNYGSKKVAVFHVEQ
jgi:hypothetical protein